jgi:hypothetical protein
VHFIFIMTRAVAMNFVSFQCVNAISKPRIGMFYFESSVKEVREKTVMLTTNRRRTIDGFNQVALKNWVKFEEPSEEVDPSSVKFCRGR